MECSLLQTFDLSPTDVADTIQHYYIYVDCCPERLWLVLQVLDGHQVTKKLIEPLLQLLELGANAFVPWVLKRRQRERVCNCGHVLTSSVPLNASIVDVVSIIIGGPDHNGKCTWFSEVQADGLMVILQEFLIHQLALKLKDEKGFEQPSYCNFTWPDRAERGIKPK